MASTVDRGRISFNLGCKITSSSGAVFDFSSSTGTSLRNTDGTFAFDHVLALEDYSLTVAAGDLDLDIFDLGTLDVGAGPGDDNLGQSHANSAIHAIMIQNSSSSTGDLRIDTNASGSWTGILPASSTLDLDAGSFIQCVFGTTGKPVVDTTNHILRLSAQGGDCTISVVFFSS